VLNSAWLLWQQEPDWIIPCKNILFEKVNRCTDKEIKSFLVNFKNIIKILLVDSLQGIFKAILKIRIRQGCQLALNSSRLCACVDFYFYIFFFIFIWRYFVCVFNNTWQRLRELRRISKVDTPTHPHTHTHTCKFI